MRLDERYRADLETYQLHPALLDVAVNMGGRILGRSSQVPLSYGRIRVWAPLGEEVVSHARASGEPASSGETVSVDVDLADPSPTVANDGPADYLIDTRNPITWTATGQMASNGADQFVWDALGQPVSRVVDERCESQARRDE